MNTLEEQLHDALHGRVDALDQAPLSFTDVRHRARRIQRRRTIAAGAGIVAAVALLVPAGLAVTDVFPRSDAPPATNGPDLTEPITIDPTAAPEGDAAGLPLLEIGEQRLLAGGEEYDLPKTYRQITPYGDGWVAIGLEEEGGSFLDILDANLAVEEGRVDARGLAVRSDGQRVAWAEDDGSQWRVLNADTTRQTEPISTELPPGALSQVVGFLPGDEVVVELLDTEAQKATMVIATRQGRAETIDTPFVTMSSSSPVSGLVAGQTSSGSASGSCSAVIDPRSGRTGTVWETCDHYLGQFSPDGSQLVGLGTDSGAAGSPALSILDAATGESLLDFTVPAVGTRQNDGRYRTIFIEPYSVVWEDDDTLLAVVVDGAEQYVARLGLDGTVERLAGPVTVNDGTVAYWLSPAAAD